MESEFPELTSSTDLTYTILEIKFVVKHSKAVS